MDEKHIPTSSRIEDPPGVIPEHQNGDEHIPAQPVVNLYTNGYMDDVIEETLYENDGGSGDNDDRTLTDIERAQDIAEDLEGVCQGLQEILSILEFFTRIRGFLYQDLVMNTACNNMGFGGSAENDGTSKVYQKHEDEPVSSSDIPGTSKKCTPPTRYQDDVLTKKECDPHVSLDSQNENAENETKPVCASDIVVESPREDDCKPSTSATVKNMENMAATLRKVSDTGRVFQGEDRDQSTSMDLHARKPTGSLDAVIPKVGKQHPMKLNLTEKTEQKTADLNYPDVAMERPNIGNAMEHKPRLHRHQILPASGETEDSRKLQNMVPKRFPILSKKEEAYDTTDGSKLCNTALTNESIPVADNSNAEGTEHNDREGGSSEDIEIPPFTVDATTSENEHTDGEEGSPEDTEILQFTVDAISSENEVTDTRTITDDHMVENELMQEIEQEDSAIREINYRELNVQRNQDDRNPYAHPTADIDLLDEPGDLDVEGYHLIEIYLHPRPQRHAFVVDDINDQDRAFNDQE